MSNYLAQYELRSAASGAPTVVHVPSGIYLHSRFDPVAEAREIADALFPQFATDILLIGHGLGYLTREFVARGLDPAALTVIEPDAGLAAIATLCGELKPAQVPIQYRLITGASQSFVQQALNSVPRNTTVIIAPFCRALARVESFPLREFINAASTEIISAGVYNPLLDMQESETSRYLQSCPPWDAIPFDRERPLIVIGAGPSLDSCLPVLKRLGDRLQLIAASGAVPALIAAGLEPSAVVAMEALPSILRDLEQLSPSIPVICFPSTAPAVFRSMQKQCFDGSKGRRALTTRGGSTVIPALDLALVMAPERIVLIGLDLGQTARPYAQNVDRPEAGAVINTVAPKFLAMRFALEALLESIPQHTRVFHVLNSGRELRGTTRVDAQSLAELVGCSKPALATHV